MSLKKNAIEHFRVKSDLYAERYSVHASGDLLWPRHRAILQMIDKMNLPDGSNILDLGCGPGFLTLDLVKKGYHCVGVDAAHAMIRQCNTRAAAEGTSSRSDYLVADVEALPFQNESFDAAICAGVIDYLPTDDNLFLQATRVLKPGGYFILCVTNKYGYTVSLSNIFYRIQKAPLVMKMISAVRRILVGGKYGAMEFTFLPRKHRPRAVREMMAKHGLKVERDYYTHFTLLPAPFCALTSRLKLTIDDKVDILDRTPVRRIGSCYMICGRKDSDVPTNPPA